MRHLPEWIKRTIFKHEIFGAQNRLMERFRLHLLDTYGFQGPYTQPEYFFKVYTTFHQGGRWHELVVSQKR